MEALGSFLGYCWLAIYTTFLQLLYIIAPGFIIATIMNILAGYVETRAYIAMGRKIYLILFGWLGTIVHELGHLVFCLVFGHRVTQVCFFDPDPDKGTLGYVSHEYNQGNLYQNIGNFFIGTGPIILGSIMIYLLSILILGIDVPHLTNDIIGGGGLTFGEIAITQLQNMWEFSMAILKSIFTWEQLSSWQFYLFIYFVFCIGSSMTLSPADLKGASKGAWLILVIWFLFNFATMWADEVMTWDIFSGLFFYFAGFYAILFIALIIVTIASVVILGFQFLSKRATEEIVEQIEELSE